MSDDDNKHGWNHPQCYVCWFKDYGIGRQPSRIKDPDVLRCCFCGKQTDSGIFRRTRPGSVEIPLCADLDLSLFVDRVAVPASPPTGPPDSAPRP